MRKTPPKSKREVRNIKIIVFGIIISLVVGGSMIYVNLANQGLGRTTGAEDSTYVPTGTTEAYVAWQDSAANLTDEEQILLLVSAFGEGVNNGDADLLVSISTFERAEEMKAAAETFFLMSEAGARVTCKGSSVVIDGETARAQAELTVSVGEESDSSTSSMYFVKQNGKWLIGLTPVEIPTDAQGNPLSDEDQIRALVQAYGEALEVGSMDAVTELVSPLERYGLEDLSGLSGVTAVDSTIEMTCENITIDGDTASCDATMTVTTLGHPKSSASKMYFVKVNGRWYLSGL